MRTRNAQSDWPAILAPLLSRYASRKHPLEYRGRYQLLVMVVLSSRTTDKSVNALAPELFRKHPTIASLAAAQPEYLYPYVRKIPGFVKKAAWLVAIARAIGNDSAIPETVEELTKLPGIGRKSANVIVSESGGTMEGIIVDLHTLRVAPRIGIAKSSTPEKVEQELMRRFPPVSWRELGMSLTYLGRDLCRPTDPNCPACPVEDSCRFRQRRRPSAERPAPRKRTPRTNR